MEKRLWRFTDDCGSFESYLANKDKTLYFPLANELIKSAVSPELRGDVKVSQNSFLLAPVSRIDLVNSRSARNFWVYIDKNKVWSACGASKDLKHIQADKFKLSAGLLWHKVERENKSIGLKSEVLSFVPASGEAVEIMQVKLTNVSSGKITFTPTAAIPIYGRGANSLRDHRHVTSLLQRITLHKFGVVTKPTLSFDEAGHEPNHNYYFVLGWEEPRSGPQYLYPTQNMFCGDGGDLEAPESVLKNLLPAKVSIQGKEPMGAMRFAQKSLAPGRSFTYILAMGIVRDKKDIDRVARKFNTLSRVNAALEETKKEWVAKSKKVNIDTGDTDFDNWLRWVSVQPLFRKIFGCSFLPDFDYGKGGRGWRDLWQDCLGLILNNPLSVRGLLVNNFSGVRIDGSNATIIGENHGEFISDRNNISRVWMDHGIWPLITLDLYMQETGDFKIIFNKTSYFRNHEVCRVRQIDLEWNQAHGQKLKTAAGKVYLGTILEHLLVENLVQFFNVGEHNCIRLEGADWNDGLDMAKEHGESVAFSSMYGQNLLTLAELLQKLGNTKVEVLVELNILLDKCNFNDKNAKLKILNEYFQKTKSSVSGRTVLIDAPLLVKKLQEMGEWLLSHIRKHQWLKEGFFNGYYDNKHRAVEGKKAGVTRMMLESQVFAIMSGAASDEQVEKILQSVKKYLLDKKLKGYHLNTDFKEEQHDLGRAFSFAYGDKENGAFFNHMVVMFAYALYKRGFAQEGWEVLSSIYKMALDTEKSKVYPCLPEYFDLEGRGMYAYLTGSASWFALTFLTQSLGVKGCCGDLCIEPKLSSGQFKRGQVISLRRTFADRDLLISFSNPKKLEYSRYSIVKIRLNSIELSPSKYSHSVTLSRKTILALPAGRVNNIEILLG